MGSMKRFMYSFIGIVVFVILPAFFIISNHLEKNFPGNDYIVTSVTGNAFVQYQTEHNLDSVSEKNETYRRKSKWIPLKTNMKIGYGALIKTEENSTVDIMRSNEMAIRIREASQVKFDEIKPKDRRTEASLQTGKIMCRINKKPDKGVSESFRVTTPVATAHVRGTTFSVHYQPDRNEADINVLNGLLSVVSRQFKDMEFKVKNGKRLVLSPQVRYPVFDMLNSNTIQELKEIQQIKISFSMDDRWEEALHYVSALPLYKKALIEITKYEMKVFVRAIRYFSPLRWGHNLPKSLKDVELEDGDYQDPWNTEYFYDKLGPKKAILISAGPDRILHTSDDIFLPIRLD